MRESTEAGAPPALSVDEQSIRVRCPDASSAGRVARRLLRLAEVRSVQFNARREEATVSLRTGAAASKMLGEITLLTGSQAAALQHATDAIRQAEDVVCWRNMATGEESYIRAPEPATGLLRLLMLTGAAVSFLLAAVGVVVPGLPTTPLLLVTSFCLVRSSRRMHQRLLNSKLFGSFLKDWHAHRAVRPGVKPVALTTIALAVGASIALGGLSLTANLGIAATACIGALVVSRLRVIG